LIDLIGRHLEFRSDWEHGFKNKFQEQGQRSQKEYPNEIYVFTKIRVRARDIVWRCCPTIKCRLRFVLCLRTCICAMRKRKDTHSHTSACGQFREGGGRA